MKGKEFCFRLRKVGGRSLLAACDSEIVGKKIRYREICFHVSGSFYGNEKTGEKEMLEKVRQSDIVNVVGKRIVKLLVDNKLVNEDCVLWMGTTPHVQIVRV